MAEPYLGQLRELIGVLALPAGAHTELACRHFFSGAALYVNGSICGSLTPVGLALKLPPTVRDALFADGRGQPLRYFAAGPIKKEYVVLSPTLLSDSPQMKKLFDQSFGYVRGE